MSVATTSLAEELASEEDEQLSQDAIWGDRAKQLVDHIKAQKPPVMKLPTVHVFAMRKGWEKPTLGGILKYCVEKKLLVGYQAVSGPTFKIPFTPVFDVATDDETAKPPATEPRPPKIEAKPPTPAAPTKPAPPAADGCLCARTAPRPNYGCPLHGRARASAPTKKENTTMAKDWISTTDAAELLGVVRRYAIKMAHDGKVVFKQDGDGGRAPFLFDRASVLAYLDKKKGDILDEPKAKKREKKVGLVAADKQIMRRAAKPAGGGQAVVVAKLADEIGALREDVITLVRVVDRGWMSQDEAFAKLRELAESL